MKVTATVTPAELESGAEGVALTIPFTTNPLRPFGKRVEWIPLDKARRMFKPLLQAFQSTEVPKKLRRYTEEVTDKYIRVTALNAKTAYSAMHNIVADAAPCVDRGVCMITRRAEVHFQIFAIAPEESSDDDD